MKKVLAILAIAGSLVACNSGSEGSTHADTTTTTTTVDTTTVVTPIDTTATTPLVDTPKTSH